MRRRIYVLLLCICVCVLGITGAYSSYSIFNLNNKSVLPIQKLTDLIPQSNQNSLHINSHVSSSTVKVAESVFLPDFLEVYPLQFQDCEMIFYLFRQ